MNRRVRNGLLFIGAGLLIAATGQYLLQRNRDLGPEQVLQKEAKLVSKELSATKRAIDEVLVSWKSGKNYKKDSISLEKLKKHGTDFFVYRDNQPEYWTTNAYNVTPTFGKGSGVQIQKNASKYVAIWSVFHDTIEYIFGKEIIRNPEFRFVSGVALQEEKENKFVLSADSLEHSIRISVTGMPPFYLVIEQYAPGIGRDLLVIAGLLIITFGIYFIFRKTKYWYLNYLFGFALWLFIEFLFYKNYTLWNLKSIALFAPEVYASSWYFPNLGVMLFNALLAYIFLFFIYKFVRSLGEIPRPAKIITRLGLLVFLCIYTVFFLDECGKLVRDSSIVFDFHEIHLISIYTILGLIATALGFGIILRVVQILYITRGKSDKTWWYLLPVVITSIIVFYQGLYLFGFLTLLLTGGLLAIEFFVKGSRPWWYYGFKIALPCIVVGIIFNRYVGQKEIELREILAAKLLLQSEREPSNLLTRTESNLRKDKSIVDYYTCTDVSKSDFERHLRQLYFAEYSEDYDILVFDYNKYGGGYREENVFDFASINGLYSSDACKQVTSNFFVVNERKLKGSFLGKFPVTDSGNFYGTYFVLLKPRLSATQGRLSDVFQKSPLEALFADNQYSYAFYSRNRLSRRYGQYNYPNSYDFSKASTLQKVGEFSHFSYSDDLGNIIVISKPLKSWLQALTAFTILVLSSLVTALIYLFVVLFRQYLLSLGKTNFTRLRLIQVLKNRIPLNAGSSLFLSSKLQLYVILVVFTTFLVVLYVTINYFKNSYTLRQREFLWNKTNEIANTIGTQTNLEALFNKSQTGLVYDLGNYYSTDINIYNSNGKLLVSSNDQIYDQDIVGGLMNPAAFADFRENGISGFIKDEAIGDLKYISAYYTIFDNDLNIKGYLNLPYFTNRQDLFREISNYATTVINLFALVFALAALVAYVIAHRITEPLNLIRRQMGLVKLGAKNAPIAWQHNDEIGLLIVEYNKMIDALEESSNRLAEGERQGAWREMAKQVAHEIKNPLTPMKLSLQHLQLAMKNNDADIQEKIKKTSELLIKQIDSLSKMAEEFSAFAKMPEAKMESIVINDLLDESVQLFEKEESVTFNYKPLKSKVVVNADGHQLNRVFTNIIKNAIQAIPEEKKGLLKIFTETTPEQVKIYFEDNGKGIPEELQKNIFSPNFSTKNSGMGLGLAISRRIIEQFHGEINFTSRPGKGSTFYVILPIQVN